MIEFRKLKHEDYEDIVDISKDIWDGTDYLPSIFHDWVDDKGFFMGAYDTQNNNKIIGVAKYSILSDGSGWLEGLRVHTNYRGKKIGKALTQNLLNLAEEDLNNELINKIGFGTHITNLESTTMMNKMNFKVKQALILAIKEYDKISSEIKIENFTYKTWYPTYQEFENFDCWKRFNNIVPLAFIFQEPTREYYEYLKKSNAFVEINGYKGVYLFKGEPHFITLDNSFDSINTFMNYYLSLLKDKKVPNPMTYTTEDEINLIKMMKKDNYTSWNDWKSDYLYYTKE